MNDQQKAQAAELHDQGLGCSAIASQVGVHPSTISRWAAKEGLDFDRTQTAVATRSAIVSRASRRQLITDRIYSQIEALLDRMQYRPDGGWMTLLRDTKGGERLVPVDELPIRDVREIAASLNALVYSVAALEKSNAMFQQEENLDAAKSLLGNLAEAMGITYPDGQPVS